jgi:hypothetical protein
MDISPIIKSQYTVSHLLRGHDLLHQSLKGEKWIHTEEAMKNLNITSKTTISETSERGENPFPPTAKEGHPLRYGLN